MGQRKLGQHTNAVIKKNVSQQRTKKGFNACLVVSPLVLCGLLFGLQLAINYLFLDRPEFRCGCKCLDCCITSPEGFETCYQNEPEKCLVADSCKRRDYDQCTIAYSTPQQFSFCEIKDPYRWPSQLQMPDSIFHNETNWESETQLRAHTLVTGRTPALDELTARLVQQKSVEPEVFSELIDLTSSLWASKAMDGGVGGGSMNVDMGNIQAMLEDSNLLTYALFSNPEVLTKMTEADLVYATPFWNDRPVAFFDSAFSVPRMMHYLQKNCSAVSVSPGEDTHCAELDLVNTLTRKDMNERQYCGFEKAVITQQVDCEGKGYPLMEYSTGWDFGLTTENNFDLIVAYNDSGLRRDQREEGPDWQNRATEQINMATQAFVKWVLGDEYSVKLRALRDMPREKKGLTLDFASLLGPVFYVLLFQLPAPSMLVTLIQEKENKVLTRMKMQGMSPLAHYIGCYLWNLLLWVLFMVITLISGYAVYDLKFFTLSDAGLLIVFILLYGNLQIAFVFILSHVFKKSKSAAVSGNLWLMLSGYLCGTLFTPMIAKDRWYMVFLELIPTLGLFRGLFEFAEYAFLGAYTGNAGMNWSKFSDHKNGMEAVMLIFFFEWIVFVVIGVLMHDESYWRMVFGRPKSSSSKQGKFVEMTEMNKEKISPLEIETEVQEEDVAEERRKVRALEGSENKGPILASNLRKVYKVGASEKVACNGVDLGVEEGECIGLLGPNGAGKTTLINMLVGYVEPTEGEAYVSNLNIRHDKSKIFESLGVCPQFDVLWPELTANQHLLFYGRIKGLQGQELERAVDEALKSVNLLDVKHKNAGSYSGGMKRRLSVAISLIGKPKVVFLDEPTTGLDPASRRELWATINKARDYASVVLTTHSMEEAQALCDRVGIFINGRLRCIGTPTNLTNRFGEYILLTTSMGEGVGEERVAAYLKSNLTPNAKEVYSFNGIQKFELPSQDVQYSQIFDHMSKAKGQGMVTDWGVSTASLEDVFLKVAAQYMNFDG
ncbi:ABC transporter A [Chloropicon primus]|nr:ABC transporter A [Chloropicon primus]